MASRRARRRGGRRPRPGRGPRHPRHAGGGLTESTLERAVTEVLIAEERLRNRVAELGEEVSADYAGRDLLLIGVLKGAVFFMADLMRNLTVTCEVDFMAIS